MTIHDYELFHGESSDLPNVRGILGPANLGTESESKEWYFWCRLRTVSFIAKTLVMTKSNPDRVR